MRMTLHAPVAGRRLSLAEVRDPLFAQHVMGEGFAVEPSQNSFRAPCSGRIRMLFPTMHVYGIEAPDGTQVMVHIGLDTGHAGGHGFTALHQIGDEVAQDDEIIRIDRAALAGYDLTTVCVVINRTDLRIDPEDPEAPISYEI